MKRSRNRYLLATYVLVLALALAAGCSTKSDPAETLVTCGNHSCGDLVMVTIDTSSNGYQYLEPTLSPDGSTIAFTTDWSAIPSNHDEGEPILSRQILVMPMPSNIWDDTMKTRPPVDDIQDLGAELIKCGTFTSLVGGSSGGLSVDGLDITKSSPVWVSNDTLIFLARFSRRDRLLIADVSTPDEVDPVPLFYEEDDLIGSGSGAAVIYHRDPALSPDGRWLAITRFICDDFANAPDVTCGGEMIYVIDMNTTHNPTNVTGFAVTTEASNMEDPVFSPDGRTICFAATIDYVGEESGSVGEIFSITFDLDEAASGSATLDNQLRRLTTTNVAFGDPIVGLQNYGPSFNESGSEIYFTSSRRAPGSTLRERSLWRIPSDGRLEPEMIFFSRLDDVDPTVATGGSPSIPLLFSSRMGFPSEQIDAIEQQTVWFYTYVYNDTAESPLTEIEIYRRGEEVREELAFFEDVMSHIYVFRGF